MSLECLAPGPVVDMTAQVVGTNYILIAFSPPRQTNGPLMGYQFAWQEVSGLKLSNMEIGPRIPEPSRTTVQIDGLKPNQTYRAYLWAYNSAGNGEQNLLDVSTPTATRMCLPTCCHHVYPQFASKFIMYE